MHSVPVFFPTAWKSPDFPPGRGALGPTGSVPARSFRKGHLRVGGQSHCPVPGHLRRLEPSREPGRDSAAPYLAGATLGGSLLQSPSGLGSPSLSFHLWGVSFCGTGSRVQLMQPGWELQPKPWELPPARVSLLWTVSNRSCPPAAGNPAPSGGGSTALTRIWVIAFQHFGLGAKIEVNHTQPGAIMREACKGAGGKIRCCQSPGGRLHPLLCPAASSRPCALEKLPSSSGCCRDGAGEMPLALGICGAFGDPGLRSTGTGMFLLPSRTPSRAASAVSSCHGAGRMAASSQIYA